MRARMTTVASRSLSAVAAAGALLGIGCGSNNHSPSISVTYTPSATAQTPGLVKLVARGSSGARLIIDAVIYGPEANLDLFAFAFDIKISDTTVAQFVPGSATAGNALVASMGQTINVIANTAQGDISDVVVGVSKSGAGTGNGISTSSAVIVEMAFDVLKAGTTTLAIAPTPTPQALDSSQPTPQPIAAVTFDPATGTVAGLSSGSPY